MRGAAATVTSTTQDAAGWGTELAQRGGRVKRRAAKATEVRPESKHFPALSHGHQSRVEDYQRDLLAKGASLILESLEWSHNLKCNPGALLPDHTYKEWKYHV